MTNIFTSLINKVNQSWNLSRDARTASSNLRPKKETDRVFCLSMQRTGTTSVGKFFRDFGFRWAGWPADQQNDWSGAWYDGNYEKIFSSPAFQSANAFEDSPWFLPA